VKVLTQICECSGGVVAILAAQSGQALWPFKSQIPGSNPGRSTFSTRATADVKALDCDLTLQEVALWDTIQWENFNSYLKKEFDTRRTLVTYMKYVQQNYDIFE